ncbi:hypothetical protein EJB05_22074 [Eragrostis curvula]|uniref:2-oxoadipate dioxygenase/decarboxylase n=1 Tax=Eragrostis curvula TaxID=38414 RepID=A0A5J9V547_9POAL|nr:hypothetical protein EJB05_22074 [Eragrostis curvula]
MSAAIATLAAARSPSAAVLRLGLRRTPSPAVRAPGLRAAARPIRGCRCIAMAAAAPGSADPIPKVDGYGINSLAEFFTDFGYVPREELRFPAKKLRALWFSPPTNDCYTGTGIYGPLPRIFISELLVDELTVQSQEIIHKYIRTSGKGNKHAALASTSGELTWEKPIYSDFLVLSRESEYAAWTLVNGYALNHATIATHRLESDIKSISKFNKFVEDNGFKLSSEGGILKVSPDGLLQQSSTVADSGLFTFADGVTESIPRSYIEFAERLLLPQFKGLQDEEMFSFMKSKLFILVKEHHRRDGFEVGNADKIFESTSKEQLTRRSVTSGTTTTGKPQEPYIDLKQDYNQAALSAGWSYTV